MFAESFLYRFFNFIAFLNAFYIFSKSLDCENIFKCLPKFAKNGVCPIINNFLLFKASSIIGNN